MIDNLLIDGFKRDLILKAALTRKGESISINSISSILNQQSSDIKISNEEITFFIKYLDNNKKNEIAETIIKPNKIQIKTNSITEEFIKNGGFSAIEKSGIETKRKENEIKEIDIKHKIWSYKNRRFPLFISSIALFISFITICFKIYETMYPKESEQIKTMKKDILKLKAQDSLILLEKTQKKQP